MSKTLEKEVRGATLILDPDKISFRHPNHKTIILEGEGIFHNFSPGFFEEVYDQYGNLLFRNPNYGLRKPLVLHEKHCGLQISFSNFMSYVGGDGRMHTFKLLPIADGRQQYIGDKSFDYGVVKAIFNSEEELIWEP